MNQLHPTSPDAAGEAARERFARRIVSTLEHGIESLDIDIGVRLRFARMRALERARAARVAAATAPLAITRQGAAVLGGGTPGWMKLAALAPLVALLSGLLLIQQAQDRAQISVAAEVDAALLADDLPPTAYTDPGFGEFLKLPPRQ